MFLFVRNLCSKTALRSSALHAGFIFLASIGLCHSSAAQTAPYVIPYTMSTYAGPHAPYTAGDACGSRTALNGPGDGCLAPDVSVGNTPTALRVDGLGNLYYVDNSGAGSLIHKINPFSLLETVYAGGSKVCTTFIPGAPGNATYGDGCATPASDGVVNNTATASNFTKAGFALDVAPNGDLYFAGYQDNYVHKIAAATDLMSIVIGNGKAPNPVGTPTDGPIATSTTDQPRGVGVDANGIVYPADTGDNLLRLVTNGNVSTISKSNTGSVQDKTTGQPLAQVALDGPEDIKVDGNGNIYIADEGTGLIRVIYNSAGIGGLPGVTAPQPGYIYTVAGGGSSSTTYPTGGSAPIKATSFKITMRKIGIDNHNDIYIGDGQTNGTVVWFLDHTTGYMRVIAGDYGQTATITPTFACSAATNIFGDGCPATQASLFAHSSMAIEPDFQGNLYIGDGENLTSNIARIRKVLSGLNFPSTAVGTPIVQKIMMHFAVNDTQAASNAYVIKGATNGTGADFTLGTVTCASQSTANPDHTDDCLLQVTFNPSQPGYDTATLTVTSAHGGVNTYELTGTGAAPAIAFDPGNTSALNTTAAALSIKNPQGVVLDGAGNSYIADTGNNRVLFYNAAAGTTTVFAGGVSSACGGATDAFGDGCPATQAILNAPKAIAIDTSGAIYIADSGNNIIRKVSPATSVISLYAGGATILCTLATDTLGDGCPAAQTKFLNPSGLAADNIGNLYIADTGNNLIRQIGSNANVSILAGTTFNGNAGAPCTNAQGATDSVGDGCSASQPVLNVGVLVGLTGASFNGPTGLAFDAADKSILVADTGDHRVRKIELTTSYKVTGANTVSNIAINPVVLIAGNGQAGVVVASGNVAANSELDAPTGVAAGADGTIYIADTGNNSVRMVTNSGVITTVAGITSPTGGTGTIGGAATATQFNLPSAVAAAASGTLFILDSGNNRILADNRSQISYDFGIIGITLNSPVQNFTELNTGTAAAALPSPLFTQSPVNSSFTLTAAASNNGSIAACATGSLAAGAICNLQAQYTPPATATESTTYTQSGTGATGSAPTIALRGSGAILTTTASSIVQTNPVPPAASQFGNSVTLQTTTTPSACNTDTPNCFATGTIVFVIDGNGSAPVALPNPGTSPTQPLPLTVSQTISGLAVGPHTISCNYSGDNFYAASTCTPITINVTQAPTTAALNATPNNAPQFTAMTISVNVTSTTGIPNGTIMFYANGSPIGTVAVNASTGSASLTLQQTLDSDLLQLSNTTLPPGSYALTCSYTGPANSDYAPSNCPAFNITIAPHAQTLALYPVACSLSGLTNQNTLVAKLSSLCPHNELSINNVPAVGTADGSTTDATIFVQPSNSITGTLTFACSGMPAASVCGFSPTSIPLVAGTNYIGPIAVDVTFWTDLQPGATTSSLRSPSTGSGRHNAQLALALGWPISLLGLAGFGRLRRRSGMGRALSLIAVFMVAIGSSLLLTSCAGPGAYKPVLTPAGTYPITITASGGGVSQTTVVDFQVASPGLSGQE